MQYQDSCQFPSFLLKQHRISCKKGKVVLDCINIIQTWALYGLRATSRPLGVAVWPTAAAAALVGWQGGISGGGASAVEGGALSAGVGHFQFSAKTPHTKHCVHLTTATKKGREIGSITWVAHFTTAMGRLPYGRNSRTVSEKAPHSSSQICAPPRCHPFSS